MSSSVPYKVLSAQKHTAELTLDQFAPALAQLSMAQKAQSSHQSDFAKMERFTSNSCLVSAWISGDQLMVKV